MAADLQAESSLIYIRELFLQDLPGNGPQGRVLHGNIMTALLIRAAAVLAAVMILSLIIDNRRFVVRRYRLRSDRINYPVKIVFIADLHEKRYGQDNEKLVEKIRETAPDVILVGGDLIVSGAVFKASEKDKGTDNGDSGTDAEWMKNSLSLIQKLAKICPVWFVQGNHELRMEYYGELDEYNKKFISEMSKAGLRFLHNKSVDPAAESHDGLDSGIRLQGLELPMKFYKKFRKTKLTMEELTGLIGEADRSVYTVLMSHIPVYFPVYADWGSDLCLCAHVHGGLMRLPLLGGVMGTRPSLFPKYSGGQYYRRVAVGKEQHLSSMILTCGLGMHTLPIRIFNPGEVSLVELLPASDPDRQEEENGTK